MGTPREDAFDNRLMPAADRVNGGIPPGPARQEKGIRVLDSKDGAFLGEKLDTIINRLNFAYHADGQPMKVAVQGDIEAILRAVEASRVEQAAAIQGLTQVVASISTDPGITLESVKGIMDSAAKEAFSRLQIVTMPASEAAPAIEAPGEPQ